MMWPLPRTINPVCARVCVGTAALELNRTLLHPSSAGTARHLASIRDPKPFLRRASETFSAFTARVKPAAHLKSLPVRKSRFQWSDVVPRGNSSSLWSWLQRRRTEIRWPSVAWIRKRRALSPPTSSAPGEPSPEVIQQLLEADSRRRWSSPPSLLRTRIAVFRTTLTSSLSPTKVLVLSFPRRLGSRLLSIPRTIVEKSVLIPRFIVSFTAHLVAPLRRRIHSFATRASETVRDTFRTHGRPLLRRVLIVAVTALFAYWLASRVPTMLVKAVWGEMRKARWRELDEKLEKRLEKEETEGTSASTEGGRTEASV